MPHATALPQPHPAWVGTPHWTQGASAWFWIAGGFLGMTGILLALALGYLRIQALETAQHLTQTFGLLVAEQSSRTLQTIDQRLELTVGALQRIDSAQQRSAAAISALFQAEISQLPFLRAMWLVDASGKVQFDSDPLNSVSDEGLPGNDVDYVQLFTAQPQLQFFIGLPARGGAQRAWIIHAARPVRSAAGKVTGVLIAAIDPHYFESLWRIGDLGSDGSIALAHRSGMLLIRSPFVETAMGKSLKERPVFKTMIPNQAHGSYIDASGVDGIERMFAYRTLVDHPDLVLIVGQSFEQALAPWRQWVRLVLLVWGSACVFVTCFGVFLRRLWLQRTQASHLLRATEERYHSLYANTRDAILVTCPDGSILNANPAACTLFGRTEADIQGIGRRGLVDQTDVRLPKALAQRAATGHFLGELSFVHKSGAVFPGEISSSIFLGPDGESRTTLIIRDITERKQSEATLQQYAEKMQVLSRRIIETQEAERRRVASELHDELGQSLTAIKINLQSGERFKNRSTEDLNVENIRIVDDALQQVRRLALALRPSILDNLGLVPALNWLGKQTAQRTELVFDFQPITLSQRLAPELETTCFRIAQEALTNITRHAQAHHFSIAMEQGDGVLVIRIQDDGVGMDWAVTQAAALAGGSFGMLGMVERATLVGGELQIQSVPGQGCTLVLHCPIRFPMELT